MAIDQIEFAGVGRATLVYLAKSPNLGAFTPLQSLRSGAMKPNSLVAQQYFAMERFHAARLAAQLSKNWDAVAAPPSSRLWAGPYLDAAKKLHAAVDLTPRFTRSGSVRSSEPTTSLDEVVASLSYKPGGDESAFRSILFIDDVIASGKTVAAIVRLLRQHGVPFGAVLQVAAPLWIPAAASASSSPG